MKKAFASLALMLLLTACSSEPILGPMRLDYSSLDKVYLDAQDLRIINRAGSAPQWPPYVGSSFKPNLTDAVYKMAEDRLQAVGTLGHATLIIKDANVTEQSLATDTGFESYFTRQQASKYIGRVEVSLEVQSPKDSAIGIASASAVHAVTLPEKPTDVEKTEAYRKLLNALMATLNTNLDQSIKTHLNGFLAAGSGGRSAAAPSVLMDGR